jgi:hypothetical protein
MVRIEAARPCIRVGRCGHGRLWHAPLVNITERRWRWQTAGDKREREDSPETHWTASRAEDEESSAESFCGLESSLAQVVNVFQDG